MRNGGIHVIWRLTIEVVNVVAKVTIVNELVMKKEQEDVNYLRITHTIPSSCYRSKRIGNCSGTDVEEVWYTSFTRIFEKTHYVVKYSSVTSKGIVSQRNLFDKDDL